MIFFNNPVSLDEHRHVKNLYGLRVRLNGSWLYFIGDKELSPQYREAILEKKMIKFSRDDTLLSMKITN